MQWILQRSSHRLTQPQGRPAPAILTLTIIAMVALIALTLLVDRLRPVSPESASPAMNSPAPLGGLGAVPLPPSL